MARVTGRGTRERDRDGHAGHRISERQRDVGLEVGAALGARPAATATGAPEHPAEQVAQIADVARLEPNPAGEPAEAAVRTAGSRTREPAAEPGGRHVAHPVVGLAFLFVAEHVVGGGDLLEPLLGVVVTGVRVGVVPLGELSVRLLDVRGARVLGHAEDAVVVLLEPLSTKLLGHPSAYLRWTLTPAGRITRPRSR